MAIGLIQTLLLVVEAAGGVVVQAVVKGAIRVAGSKTQAMVQLLVIGNTINQPKVKIQRTVRVNISDVINVKVYPT